MRPIYLLTIALLCYSLLQVHAQIRNPSQAKRVAGKLLTPKTKTDKTTNVGTQKHDENKKEDEMGKEDERQALLMEPTPINQLQLTALPIDTTRYPWADQSNMVMDIELPHIAGYEPKWQYFSFYYKLPFDVLNLKSNVKSSAKNSGFSLVEDKGKTFIYFDKMTVLSTCDCYMEVKIPDGKAVVINDKPQTFELGPCRMPTKVNGKTVLSNEGCNPTYGKRGQFEGRLKVQSSKTGDITFTVQLQAFTNGQGSKPAVASHLYTAANVLAKNLRPADVYVYDIIAKKPEKEFLNALFDFLIMGKDQYGMARMDYLPGTLAIDEIKHDKEGGLSQAKASYQCIRTAITGSDTATLHMELLFDQNLVYRVSYPDEPIFAHLPNRVGVNGNLIFTKAELARMDVLNKPINEQTARLFKENQEKALAKIMAEVKAYTGKECSECLTKEMNEEPYTYTEVVTDADGEQHELKHQKVRYNLTVKNVCDKTVLLVGIQKKLDSKKGIYYVDATRTYAPHAESTFLYDPTLASMGLTNDINFKEINPVYNDKDMPVGSTQYLRIVYK